LPWPAAASKASAKHAPAGHVMPGTEYRSSSTKAGRGRVRSLFGLASWKSSAGLLEAIEQVPRPRGSYPKGSLRKANYPKGASRARSGPKGNPSLLMHLQNLKCYRSKQALKRAPERDRRRSSSIQLQSRAGVKHNRHAYLSTSEDKRATSLQPCSPFAATSGRAHHRGG